MAVSFPKANMTAGKQTSLRIKLLSKFKIDNMELYIPMDMKVWASWKIGRERERDKKRENPLQTSATIERST